MDGSRLLGHHLLVEQPPEGWQPDPLGRHDERWLSAGALTDLARDGGREIYDPPDPSAPRPSSPRPYERGVDDLPSESPFPRPWRPSPWQKPLLVAAACCGVVALLAVFFGHAVAPPKPLGPHEVIGTVQFEIPSSHYVMISYTPPGSSQSNGMASGYDDNVGPGQSVVVRYDSKHPAYGTILSQPVPRSSPNGPYGVFIGVLGLAGFGTAWAVLQYRGWRRYLASDDNVDYRADPWAGTTNSA